jgi:hypothetical protein
MTTVALDHTKTGESPGEPRDLVEELGIGERPDRVGDRAVVDQGWLRRPPGGDVPVESVVTGVQAAVGKPAVEGMVR